MGSPTTPEQAIFGGFRDDYEKMSKMALIRIDTAEADGGLTHRDVDERPREGINQPVIPRRSPGRLV